MDIAGIEAALVGFVLPDGSEIAAVVHHDEPETDEVNLIATFRHAHHGEDEVHARLPRAMAADPGFDPRAWARVAFGHLPRSRHRRAAGVHGRGFGV